MSHSKHGRSEFELSHYDIHNAEQVSLSLKKNEEEDWKASVRIWDVLDVCVSESDDILGHTGTRDSLGDEHVFVRCFLLFGRTAHSIDATGRELPLDVYSYTGSPAQVNSAGFGFVRFFFCVCAAWDCMPSPPAFPMEFRCR